MKAWHPRTTSSIAAIIALAATMISLPAKSAQAEAMIVFRNPDQAPAIQHFKPTPAQQKLQLKLDDKGDLLIKCGCARFVVAYNSPTDQLKPGEQQGYYQREEVAAINGISLTASVSF